MYLREATDRTDLCYILQCAPMDISLRTGLSVRSDFGHIDLEMKETEYLERAN